MIYFDRDTGASWDFEPAGLQPFKHRGEKIQPCLYGQFVREEWDEHWDTWARTALASGAFVPPLDGLPRRNPLFMAFCVAVAALAILAPALIWGIAR